MNIKARNIKKRIFCTVVAMVWEKGEHDSIFVWFKIMHQIQRKNILVIACKKSITLVRHMQQGPL